VWQEVGTFLSKLLEGASGEVGKTIAQYALTAVAGGGLTWALRGRRPLSSKDFRITKESTTLTISPVRQASDSVSVRVVRNYEMKLHGRTKKGVYKLYVDLKGNNVSGQWESGCQFLKNDKAVSGLVYDDNATVISARPCNVSALDVLKLTLISVETISRKRGFYALAIDSPKDETQFKWNLKSFGSESFKAKAFASSEDFDLIILPQGDDYTIGKSLHSVSYFVTWSKELVPG
jgi:hypothetical protein